VSAFQAAMPLKTPDAITQICSHEKDDFYVNNLRGT